MSEPIWRSILAAATAAALLSGPARAASGCALVSQNFALCTQGTPWAQARWISFGDGAALELDGFYLEITEDWATRQDSDPLDAALDALLAEMNEADVAEGARVAELLHRDAFESPPLQVVRAVHDIAEVDDDPLLMAVMLARDTQGANARIALMFGHDGDIDNDTLDQQARSLIALVRPAEER